MFASAALSLSRLRSISGVWPAVCALLLCSGVWLYPLLWGEGLIGGLLTNVPVWPWLGVAAGSLGLSFRNLRRRSRASVLVGLGLSAGALGIAVGPLGGFVWSWGRGGAPQTGVRLMTFNVEQWGAGAEGIAGAIRAARPDVFCLQEAGRYAYVADMEERWRLFETELAGYHIWRVGEVVIGANQPLLDAEARTLPRGPESRPLVSARVRTSDGRSLRVGCVHLLFTGYRGFSPSAIALTTRERRVQAGFVADWMLEQKEPTVVAGDLNSGFRSEALRRLNKVATDAWRAKGRGFGMTHSSRWPQRRLDYVFLRGGTVLQVEVLRAHVSDHFPVLAELSL